MQTSSSNFLLPISCHVLWCDFSTKRNHWFDFSLNFRHFIKEFKAVLSPTAGCYGVTSIEFEPSTRRGLKKKRIEWKWRERILRGTWRNVTNHTRWTPTSCWISSYNRYMAEKTHGFLAVFFFFTCIFFVKLWDPAYRRGPLCRWLVGSLGWWFGILGIPESNNPFHFRASQESEPPGPQTTN